MASLENVKTLLDIELYDSTQDEIINLYISRATNFARRYCNIPDGDILPSSLLEIVEDIVVYKYRLKGAEGIKSESKGSLTESYITSLPPDIVSGLNMHKRLRFI